MELLVSDSHDSHFVGAERSHNDDLDGITDEFCVEGR